MLSSVLTLLLAVTPLAIRVEVQPLGRGTVGTVVGVAVQLAPEDRERVGERLEVSVAFVKDGAVVDEGTSVVALQPDGSALLFRDWPVGAGEVRVRVTDPSGLGQGAWAGPLVVPAEATPFTPPDQAPPDAVALAPAPALEGGVRFLVPERAAGLGALQLEVVAPGGTARVEFFQDDGPLVQKNRPPWTVSVTLGEVARRTTVRALARAADGSYLGEDAIVLNAAPGQIPLEILIAPEPIPGTRERLVTVGGTGGSSFDDLTLSLDDAPVARFAQCPCVVRLAEDSLTKGRLLSAEVRAAGVLRGQAVRFLRGGGFVDAVKIEQVELSVLVVNARGAPVAGLTRDSFQVFEDGEKVEVDGFAASAELPLSLGIVVDISGSMKEPFPAVRKAVRDFAAGLLRRGDRFFLMTFAFEPVLRLGWTPDAAALGPALERIEPDGGTALHDAVVRSLEQFRSERGRKAVVLLTDGDDTVSRTGWNVALRYARTARTPVFPIGFRIPKLAFFVRERLHDLAVATGGEVFYAPASGELVGVYERISEQLRSQYLLSYRSPSTKGQDHFRQLSVKVVGEGLTARTIAGYFPAS